MSFLQIYHWVCQWKTFENRLTFAEVMGKSCVLFVFLTHGVESDLQSHLRSLECQSTGYAGLYGLHVWLPISFLLYVFVFTVSEILAFYQQSSDPDSPNRFHTGVFYRALSITTLVFVLNLEMLLSFTRSKDIAGPQNSKWVTRMASRRPQNGCVDMVN